ncbi:DUF6314 family protein [Salinisphaera sp. T31B1]|uniref:DUF6314 family protein n=1 Tax=Salinisphaera sp. T31B1 TaxID=727963 RepID=UPI00333F93D4
MKRTAALLSDESAIIDLWRRLPSVRRLTFSATAGPDSVTGWTGTGLADVVCEEAGDGLRFIETGRFTLVDTTHPLTFHNVFHWRAAPGRVALAHERFGRDAPVWLFDLIAAAPGELTAAESHLCGNDRYDARLRLVDDGFDLRWTISGPRKDETLAYRYRF